MIFFFLSLLDDEQLRQFDDALAGSFEKSM
jgi:hypothetical protein